MNQNTLTGTNVQAVVQGAEIEEQPRDDSSHLNTAEPQRKQPTLRFRGRAKDIFLSRALWETRFE